MRLTSYWNLPGLSCFNITAEGSVKAIAVINMIGCLMSTVMVTRDVIDQEGFPVSQNLTDGTTIDNATTTISATVAFHYFTWTLLYLKDLVDFIVSICLFKAVKPRILLYCKLYFCSTFLVLQAFTVYLIDIFVLRTSYTITVSVIIGLCFHLFYKPYSVWVILTIMKILIGEEKEQERKDQQNTRRLTEAEIEEFYKGAKVLSPMSVAMVTEPEEKILPEEIIEGKYSNVTPAELSAYVRNDIFLPSAMLPPRHEAALSSFDPKFELKPEEFTVDETKLLGSGAFGSVYVGELLKNVTETSKPIQVAVKTTKSHNRFDVEYFKTLLDEVKIMCYIGQHSNIVNLVGVCTSNITNCEVQLVMELCEKGTLKNFLRDNKRSFQVASNKNPPRVRKSAEYMKHITRTDEPIVTADLIKWGYEIGLGMEFLVQNKVCHGDLALRNVLVTGNRTAKIADFGLARKLYNYVLYARGEEATLPWRHLAPETLRNLTFSEKTDVWTYGITLWELYSLGEKPWSEYEYDPEFVAAVLGGKRLERPPHCPFQVYAIMEACWSVDESLRPTFTQLTFHNNVLRQILSNT